MMWRRRLPLPDAHFAAVVWAEPVTVPVTPIQVGPHSRYVQGMAGKASAARQGFTSDATHRSNACNTNSLLERESLQR